MASAVKLGWDRPLPRGISAQALGRGEGRGEARTCLVSGTWYKFVRFGLEAAMVITLIVNSTKFGIN